MLREGRKSGFRTVTVGGPVLGTFAMPLRRRLEGLEHIVFNTSERTYMIIAFPIAGPENSLQLSYEEKYTNEYSS